MSIALCDIRRPVDFRYAPLPTDVAWRCNMSRRVNNGQSLQPPVLACFTSWNDNRPVRLQRGAWLWPEKHPDTSATYRSTTTKTWDRCCSRIMPDLARRIATLNPRRVLETAALPKADIQNLACTGAVTLAALISPSSPAGVVTEQLGLNIDGYLRDRPIYRRPREHSQS
jgi:hypothetical protein